MLPADQVVVPFRRNVADVKETVAAIADVAVAPTVSVLPSTLRPLVRSMLPTAASPVEIDGVPAAMTTSSVADGTPTGLQFAGVCQFPPPPTHVLVSAAAFPAEPSHNIVTITSVAHRARRDLLRPCNTRRSSPRRWIAVNYSGAERSGSSSK